MMGQQQQQQTVTAAGGALRRAVVLLTVVALMAVMLAMTVAPAFARASTYDCPAGWKGQIVATPKNADAGHCHYG
jgi:hypothetical protein